MYFIFELFAVVGMVAVLATILFVASATVIVIDEGMRWALGRSAKLARHGPSFSLVIPKGWGVTIPGQLVSLHPKAGKL